MKTLTLALALASLFTAQAFACSPSQNFGLRLKNTLITELVNDYRVNASIDNLISIEVKNLSGGAFYTFPDRGADCPDSVRISGEIDLEFRRALRFNQVKAEVIWDLLSQGKIDNAEADRRLNSTETCSLTASVKSEKIPTKRGQRPSYYSTEIQGLESLRCEE